MMPNVTLRTLQIDIISGSYNPIIVICNQLLSNVIMKQMNIYNKNGNEYLFYKNTEDKKWLFLTDQTKKRFWCNYDFYMEFSKIYNFNYDLNIEILKIMLENNFNIIINNNITIRITSHMIEKAIIKYKI